ncbi:cysteine desulfurase family protein [Mongoliibacter ruber]|uniref:cysteine desulfurase n=1 Tax=Mongoliibacter ruber TaxID=1750599 RepID=A0A2T0WUV1_9BACT|nr:cysteine desulfurase family protein [Mongoliibacter ruber]PRY90468.1 cysteine desulfurase [Mongoliibacter ruber]
MKYPIYLDYNATTPCHPEVLGKMTPWFTTHFGNAASKSHPFGWIAEDAVELARDQVAQLIGARSKEIIFTSGATEAINLGIKGIFEFYSGQKQHYITCQTEHKAVLDTFRSIEEKGALVTYLSVNDNGEISLEQLKDAIIADTKMIALMWANNETGVIHPVSDIANLAEQHNIIFFTDAVQAVGKIPVNIKGIHMMAISGHKFYGPKGVGALFIRHNHPLPKPLPIIVGGGHEKGYRSGTLNVPGIVGMGEAARIAVESIEELGDKLNILRNKLEKELLKIPGTQLNSSQDHRIPHVCNVSFEGVGGEELLQMLNKEIAVSSGSACTSISPKPSHVLEAMGVKGNLGRSSVRFSLGMFTTEDEIDFTIAYVKKVVGELRT